MRAGSQRQVIGISQQDLSAEAVKFIHGEGFNRRLGAYGHEYGCIKASARQAHGTGASASIASRYLELETIRIAHKISIASP